MFLITLVFILLAEELPLKIQVPMFFKISSYDRNLQKRCKDTVRLGIFYDPERKSSVEGLRKFLKVFKAMEDKIIANMRVKIIFVSTEDKISKLKRVDILYICPLKKGELPVFTKVADKFGLLTLSSDAKDVELGVAVGLTVEANRPRIVINLDAAKRQGADFSSNLLELAKVIREKE